MKFPVELFGSESTAFLVVDKQKAYMDETTLKKGGRSVSDEFHRNFQHLEDYIITMRRRGIRIIWTQMTEDEDLSSEPIRKKMAFNRQFSKGKPIIARPGQSAFEFAGKVKPLKTEMVMQKDCYDSFGNPELDKYLRSNDIKSVILTGGFTSRCVLGTAFGANSHGYNVLLLEDLLIIPDDYISEVPTVFSIVQGVLGYVTKSDELLKSWSEDS